MSSFFDVRPCKKINKDLEGKVADRQKELDGEIKKAELLEKRFMDLAGNNQAIITFMDEYKNQNAQLKLENKELQSENDKLFSKKLQDKEECIQKLRQEMKQLREKYMTKENEFREKLAGFQSKLMGQTADHQAKEASLLNQLHDAQIQHRDAVEMCKDLKLKVQKAEDEQALKELNMSKSMASLAKERDKLLHLSMERGKVIQEKQEEIQELETKWKEEKKARVEAEDRFERETEAVNADLKVKSLQSALDESMIKYRRFKEEFKAFREHSSNLLVQERELNKRLRHMMN